MQLLEVERGGAHALVPHSWRRHCMCRIFWRLLRSIDSGCG